MLAKKMKKGEMELLEEFGRKYLQGDLLPWFFVVWLSGQTVTLYKHKEQTAARRLGMRNHLLKQLYREPISQNMEAIVNYFEPHQLLVS